MSHGKMVILSEWHRKLDKNKTLDNEDCRKLLHSLINLYPQLLQGKEFIIDEKISGMPPGPFRLTDMLIYYPDKIDLSKLVKSYQQKGEEQVR